MNRFGLSILVLLLITGSAAGQVSDAVAAFDAGAALILEGHYRDALEQFDSAERAGYESAELHYHRGIAHFRLDELGLAIRDFHRAERLDPSNRFIAHNLEIARARISQPISRLPVSLTARFWQRIARRPLVLFLLGFVAYLLFLGTLLRKARTRSSGDWTRRIVWSSGITAATLIGLAFLASAAPPLGRQAVVISPSTELHVQADNASETISRLSEGITVNIDDESGLWLAVRLPNGQSGWLLADAIVEI